MSVIFIDVVVAILTVVSGLFPALKVMPAKYFAASERYLSVMHWILWMKTCSAGGCQSDSVILVA